MGDSTGGHESPHALNSYKDNVIYDFFKVIFECKRASDKSKFLPYLCKYKVGQAVSQTIDPNDVSEYKRISRNKIIVSCKSSSAANKLALDDKLKESYNVFIPSAYLYKFAIIKDIDLDFGDDEILENIDARNYNVVGVQRLNRRVLNENSSPTYVPSRTVKLMIEGQSLPSYVYLFHVKGEIEPYMQPVMQCFKCLRYGHTSGKCRSEPRCKFCAEPKDDDKEHACKNSDLCCYNCKASHCATAKRDCPEYSRQCDIKTLMLAKSLCFQEACTFFPTKRNNNTFSSKTSNKRFQFVNSSSSNFPAMKENPNIPSPSQIDPLVIPLSSGVSTRSQPQSFELDHDYSNPTPKLTEPQKRRMSPVKMNNFKRRIQSRPNPTLDYNSSLMKEQLYNTNQFPGANGVCLKPLHSTESSSIFTASTSSQQGCSKQDKQAAPSYSFSPPSSEVKMSSQKKQINFSFGSPPSTFSHTLPAPKKTCINKLKKSNYLPQINLSQSQGQENSNEIVSNNNMDNVCEKPSDMEISNDLYPVFNNKTEAPLSGLSEADSDM
ncbi:hypothetical protein M8J76_014372 [Diaphorina citri]|nr:hypothetical protein M8J76_014372 [Diaphorina citri]KAI5721691.1 hypothetical protein M8J77_024207 [Diaphorina citri]